MMRTSIRLAVAAVLVAGGARGASAQDVRVRDVVRDALRIVQETIGSDLGRQIDDAVREATAGLESSGHPGAPAAAVQNRDFQNRVEDRQTKTLKLGASGSLELRNISGAITVAAGSGTEAVVEILRTSRGRTPEDAKAGLERVTVEVTQVGDRATVQTRYPDERRPAYSVEVQYHVKAPAGTHLTISSIGGDITVSDIRGDASTSTTGGNTTITGGRVSSAKSVGGNVHLTGTETDGTLEVETFGGQIVLKQVKARRVQAGNIGGGVVVQDTTCEAADLGSTGGDVEFTGPVTKNGRYALHSTGGAVRFVATGGAGYELQVSTFSGEIRTEGVAIQAQGAATGHWPSRSLRGTVGDGSALVILRTLSGNVTIGRK